MLEADIGKRNASSIKAVKKKNDQSPQNQILSSIKTKIMKVNLDFKNELPLKPN